MVSNILFVILINEVAISSGAITTGIGVNIFIVRNLSLIHILRGIASYRKVCTAVGRQVAQSRSATLPLISGMDLRKLSLIHI